MSALATWVRLDLRRRGRSLAVLAVLVALTTATVLTAVAGARRGSTAVDRLLDRTRPATIAVLPNEAGFDWEAVAAIDGVEAIARFPLSQYLVDGLPADAADFAYADPSIMETIERPVVLEGRMADPARADEAVVTEEFEGTYGKGVGDTVVIRLFTPEQLDENELGISTEAPGGPRVEATIVGVVRSAWFSDTAGVDDPGRLIPSYGLFARYPDNLVGGGEVVFLNALVRLDGGGAAIPQFRERLAEVSGRQDIDFFNLVEMAEHASDVGGFEADNLFAFALAAGIAAVFLVGQSVVRYAAGSTSDLEVLRAVGMPPAHVRAGVAVGPFLAAVAGALVGGAVSVGLSSRFPIGTVAPLEPDPGRDVDVLVLGVGLVAIPVLTGLGALIAARRSAVAEPSRGSAVAALIGRWGAPVPLQVGARFALERGRGSQAVPVRPALVGAVVGVLGVVAALTFADGVGDASENPARFGQVFELESFLGFNGQDFVPVDEVTEVFAADPDVIAVNDSRQGVAEVGSVDVAVFSLDPVGQPLDVVVLEGRLPEGPKEVALAPTSARDLDVVVGDTVDLAGTAGAGPHTVTGLAFVPTASHSEYDEGAWMESTAFDRLFDGFKFHNAHIAVRDGVDPAQVAARLGATVAERLGDPALADEAVVVSPPPSRLAELEQVRRLPLFLAAFLAVLAVGAVGHALATAVRRRRHDLAVLRALGATRWDCRSVVLTQASLLALFGLVVGVPTGVALGQTLWRGVAETTPLAYVTPIAAWLLVLIAPIALLVANLLAAWPSHRAASLRVGQVLRTE
jgi:hypothetical protein